jgi:pimeloyl-ACP methyl ester carboxylesterase
MTGKLGVDETQPDLDSERPHWAERVDVVVTTGRRVSALRWGTGEPEVVLLHGGAQNAHTWDAVATALDRSLLCIDLPGHGNSQWRDDHDYRPRSLAVDVSDAITQLAPRAELVGGMSLGGMTAIAIAETNPDLVDRLTVVDVAPGSGRHRTGSLFDFVNGSERFGSLDEIVERAERVNFRPDSESLRRGIRNNTVQNADGTWQWRYDPAVTTADGVASIADAMLDMWGAVSRIAAPTLLVRGALSPAVSPDDVDEWRHRQPAVRLVTVEGAGHSVQSDKPRVLARLLRGFLDSPLERSRTTRAR